ncbi:MAG: peroxiredoxin family protein [Candidatus Bipolaricaulaceae bacterium]
MYRVCGLLAGLLLGCAAVGAAHVTGHGLLGDMVQGPLLGAAYRQVPMSRAPGEELTAVPCVDDLLYAGLELGAGVDRTVTVAVRPGDPPLLWLDANNNEDMLDDRGPLPPEPLWPGVFRWKVEVRVEYQVDGERYLQPYYLVLLGEESDEGWSLHYSSGGLRKGLLEVEGGLYQVYLGDADHDGRYDDVDQLVAYVDVNQDGRIAWQNEVYEVFTPPGSPIQIGQKVYAVAEASADGRRVELIQVGRAATPPVLLPGHRAPDFTAQGADGSQVSLSALRGQVVVLLFLKFEACRSCPLCGNQLCQRALQVQQVLEGMQGVAVVGVSQDRHSPDPDMLAELGIRFPVVWGEQLDELYRWSTLLILDQQGVIRAGDSYRVVRDGPHIVDIPARRLQAVDVVRLVARLLEGG